MLGLDLSAPDHTTLSRRGQHIDLPLPPQDRIGLERRGVNPNGVALDQIRSRQHLQDPREDGPMRLHVDQPARPRDRRMLGRRLVEAQPQEAAERK